VENHDEPRAAAVFDQAALRAAMTVVATLPGTTLWHEGEFDGRRVHLPVLLGRRPIEVSDPELRHFAEHTLAAAERVRHGNWATCTTTGWPDNQSHEQLLTWRWAGPDHEAVVVVNFAEHPAQGRVHLGASHPACVTYDDLLSGATFERDGGELDHDGLYVDLPPYGAHVLVARG
jgi:hypothetical protein